MITSEASAAAATRATMTVTLWIRATCEISNPKRRTSSSPAWGPVPVTTVPVARAAAVNTEMMVTSCRVRGSNRAAWSWTSAERPIATTPKVIDTIARRKCDCTRAGCRSARTAMPPTTPLANTESNTPTAGQRSPTRRGRWRNAAIARSNVGIPITPLSNRLACSIAVCPDDTSTKRSALQFGQSSQPNPLPVSRTAPPATTSTQMPTVVIIASRRYRSSPRSQTPDASRNICG